MRSKLQKTLDYQQNVNEAVKKLVESFNPQSSMTLSDHYKMMAETQVQVMSMLQLSERLLERRNDEACKTLFVPNDVTAFFSCVLEIYKLLEPFDEMAQEQYQLSRQSD